MADKPGNDVDWSLATWEGATRETMRRWAVLPLEKIIAALEEMQALNETLHGPSDLAEKAEAASRVQQQHGDYECGSGDETSGK